MICFPYPNLLLVWMRESSENEERLTYLGSRVCSVQSWEDLGKFTL